MAPLFKRYVEAGRVVIGKFGDVFDKPAVIVDIVDLNRVVIEGPTTGVARQITTLKRLQLTDLKIDISRGASTADVKEALKANDVVVEWQQSSWGKKRATFHAKRQLNDFARFKVQRARSVLSKLVKSK